MFHLYSTQKSCSNASCHDESEARADLSSLMGASVSTECKMAAIRSEEWEVGMGSEIGSDEDELVWMHSV